MNNYFRSRVGGICMQEFSALELKECARRAVERYENGEDNIHQDFVKIFVNKTAFQKELFVKALEDKLDEKKIESLVPMYYNVRTGDPIEYKYKNGKPGAYFDKWKNQNENDVPDRDVIVQIGIHSRLSIEETNMLLMSAGHRRLYYVDPYDLISMICLLNYNNKDIDANTKMESYLNGIEKVKGMNFEQKHREKLGKNTSKKIEAAIRYISPEGTKVEYNPAEYRSLITLYAKNSFSLDKLMDDNIEEIFNEIENLKEVMSVGFQYSYYNKLEMYLKDTSRFIKYFDFKEYDFLKKTKSISAILDYLYMLWSDKPEATIGNNNKYALRYLYEGRKIVDVYETQNKNIINMYKLCVVTGREDEIGEFLCVSGYKRENENINLLIDSDEKRYWEKTECLMVYALMYRNLFLDRKCETTTQMQKAKEDYLFRDLLVQIGDEVMEKVKGMRYLKKRITSKNNVLLFTNISDK